MPALTLVPASPLHCIGEDSGRFSPPARKNKAPSIYCEIFMVTPCLERNRINVVQYLWWEGTSFLWPPAARGDYELGRLYVCLCNFTICGQACHLMSLYERLHGAGCFFPICIEELL